MLVPMGLANMFCLVLGYLYPAYASFKTLERPYDAEQYRRWLVYWVVISSFSALELLGDSLLFWFPFYFECKMAAIAWLVLPYFGGSSIIYHRYLEPLLETYYPRIDNHVEKARSVVTQVIESASAKGMDIIRSKSTEIMSRLANSSSNGNDSSSSPDSSPTPAEEPLPTAQPAASSGATVTHAVTAENEAATKKDE